MGFFFFFYQFDPELYFFQCFELFLFQNYAPFPCQLTNSKEESLWRLFVPVLLRFRVRHGTSSLLQEWTNICVARARMVGSTHCTASMTTTTTRGVKELRPVTPLPRQDVRSWIGQEFPRCVFTPVCKQKNGAAHRLNYILRWRICSVCKKERKVSYQIGKHNPRGVLCVARKIYICSRRKTFKQMSRRDCCC